MSRRWFVRSRLIISGLILLVYGVGQLALTPRPAHAATIAVTTAADGATCATAPAGSLRTALCGALNPGDIINIGVAGPIVLVANLPNITVGGAGLTINGSPTTIQGGMDIRGFTVAAGGVLTLNNLTIAGATCNGGCPVDGVSGGGVYNQGTLTITNSTISGNSAFGGFSTGGGVRSTSGMLMITNSIVSGNSGGGVRGTSGTLMITSSTVSGNLLGFGVANNAGTATIASSTVSGNSDAGGVYNDSNMTIINSTVSGNSATGSGGGVLNIGGALTITNSTIFGNSATGAFGLGGGVFNDIGSTLTITNSTIFGNSATVSGGGVYSNAGITATVQNTIISASTNGDCVGAVWVAGSANNRTTDACTGNLGPVTGLSPTLANNGGPTQTLALLAGSNAIDQPGVPCLVTTDQRGTVRPQGAGCDIGAFEFVAAPAAFDAPAPVWPTPPPCPDAMSRVDPAIRAIVPPGIARAANGALATVYICPLTDAVQIGVLDRPIVRAYEVFALTPGAGASVTRFSAPIRVCLQGSGVFLFRDANRSPRLVTELPASVEGGFTCASVPNAGTMILVAGAPSLTAPQTVTEHALTGCQITTRNITNLHDGPAANAPVIALVATNTTLHATARAGDWIKVVYQDRQGYISAAIVNTDGACE